MGVKVQSSLMCFYHGRRFRPGEVFELPDGVVPSKDMVVVSEDTKTPAGKPRKEETKTPAGKPRKDETKTPAGKPRKDETKTPETFSELAKQDSDAQIPKGTADLA
ncbi:MAG: hypothetical protein KJ778_08135 [Gammaproteobacteria bacterium]|nr:hypothetical protein [Gammaproteobacteria bacterium]